MKGFYELISEHNIQNLIEILEDTTKLSWKNIDDR